MQHSYASQKIPTIAGANIAILQSKWHKEHTDVMLRKCVELLKSAGAKEPEVHVLPGALELPLAAQRLLRTRKKYDALIAIGAIIKGDTFHFEMVMNMCMDGLNRVMLAEDVPIIVEVLPVSSLDQLLARCGDNDQNKGLEAAIAAAEIICWRNSIRTDQEAPRIGVRHN
jgi:6,7-dimethyl-8-ribityllumazine synthase